MRRWASLGRWLTVAVLAGCDPATPASDAGLDVRAVDVAPLLDTPPSSDVAPDAPAPIDGGSMTDAGGCAARPTLGLFVWTDDLSPRRDELLDLAEANGVTEIYLHTNRFYVGELSEMVLADWITAANARCIEVELLFGNARWILPSGHPEARARTDWAVAYAASHPDARPSGLHFDLEPQQLAEWGPMPARRPTFISNLVDLLETMTPVAEAGGLPLTNDIGFFLDDYTVTRSGTSRPGYEWVIDAVSRIVVMDYRDSADSMGFGGMISLAQSEVGYASRVGTPIVLAVETQPVPEEYVTFREEGRAVLFSELAIVRSYFSPEPAFAGFAIHDETGLAALPP